AYYLSKAGAAVLLLEQGDVNREASGRNAGSLHFQLEYRLLRYGEDQAAQFAQIIPLSLVAIEDWSGLEEELQADLELEMGGGLILAETPADVAILEKRQALQERWNLPTKLVSATEVRRMAPYLSDTVVAAGYCPHEGHANPRLVAPAFARRAQSSGTELRGLTRVSALLRDGAEWRVQFQSIADSRRMEEVACRAVLNAAGAWAAEIAAMAHLHLPMFAVPLSMNVLERSSPLIPHLVQHTSERLTVKQVSAGNVLIGGGWPARFPTCETGMDTRRRPRPVLQNVVANLAIASRLVPDLRDRHLIRTWTGTTGVTSDQMPLLGEVPEAPGFYVAAGGAAFTHGPTYARLISELIVAGRTSQSIELYSPARFSHVNNFMASV
ncbi:MAG: NAD(P)/FAD-dependent oxidoreductase, partial [Woeseiaceae bacterium]